MRIAGILAICLFCVAPSLPPVHSAPLVPLDDAALDDVRGQSGIAFAIDGLKIYSFDTGFAIEDTTDNNTIILFDVMSGIDRLTTNLGITLRVYQNQHDYAMIALEALRFEGLDMPAIEMDMRVDVMDFSFYDAAGTTSKLGSLHVAGFSPSEFALYAAPVGTIWQQAGSGVGFQVETRLEIEEFRWVYNDDAEELRIGGMHLVGSFQDNPLDDYTDPTSWIPDGRFAIGRIDPREHDPDPLFDPANPAPASFHGLKADPADDPFERGFLRIQLPETRGSLRIEEMELGDKNFGPVIIDGFRAHHLQVDLVPWQ